MRIINSFDATDTILANDFSPESISVSQIKSVTMAIPVTFNNKLICSVLILNTEKMESIFEIKTLISSTSNEKINTTTNIRSNKTYSGLYDLRITESSR